jgi:hypothetical protein
MKITEIDVGRAVVSYIRANYPLWDVYQEYSLGYGRKRADIIAAFPGPPRLLWVVECKTKMSLHLLAQAREWLHHVHYVSIACAPAARTYADAGFVDDWLKDHGIGMIVAHDNYCSARTEPQLHRAAHENSKDIVLCEGHKNETEAGSKSGGFWTPFRETCNQLKGVVGHSPGLTIKEAMAAIEHHYSSDIVARSSMRVWLNKGIVKGVEMKYEAGKYHLYPEDGAAQLIAAKEDPPTVDKNGGSGK